MFNMLKFFYYDLLSRINKSMTVKKDGKFFKLKTSTSHEVHRALTFEHKEPETLNWIEGFGLHDGDMVFYDVGANIGIYSLYAALLYKKAAIYAFEPDSQSFGSLCLNISNNQLNIAPYPFAISDESGVGLLHTSILKAGAGASALDHDYVFTNLKNNEIFKQGIFYASLDDLVFKYDFPQPNFIKIDVDGIEEKILNGASRVLSSDKCRRVLVEIQYKDSSDIMAVSSPLLQYGFEMQEKSRWITESSGFKSQNFIFIKK